MLDIHYICCQLCRGLFPDDEKFLTHKRCCSGDLAKSSCEYVACAKGLYLTHIRRHNHVSQDKLSEPGPKRGRPKGSLNRPKVQLPAPACGLATGRYSSNRIVHYSDFLLHRFDNVREFAQTLTNKVLILGTGTLFQQVSAEGKSTRICQENGGSVYFHVKYMDRRWWGKYFVKK